MSDFLNDPSHPNRPQHPDFWKLSEILLKLDGRVEEGKVPIEEIFSEHIDPEVLAYVALQRGMRMLPQIVSSLSSVGPEHMIAALSGIWMDAFMTGVEFGKQKQ